MEQLTKWNSTIFEWCSKTKVAMEPENKVILTNKWCEPIAIKANAIKQTVKLLDESGTTLTEPGR